MGKKLPEDIANIVGGYILERREFLGLSQKNLSNLSGVTIKQISRIENSGDGKFIYIIKIYQAMGLGNLLKHLDPKSKNDNYVEDKAGKKRGPVITKSGMEYKTRRAEERKRVKKP